MTPSPFILRLQARDRAASYIVTVLAVPLIVFGVLAVATMLGAAPALDIAYSLFPALLWSFLALGALSMAFQLYCWLTS